MVFWDLDYTKGAVGTPLKKSYSDNYDFMQSQGPTKQIIRCYFHHGILNQKCDLVHWIDGDVILVRISPISWDKNPVPPRPPTSPWPFSTPKLASIRPGGHGLVDLWRLASEKHLDWIVIQNFLSMIKGDISHKFKSSQWKPHSVLNHRQQT